MFYVLEIWRSGDRNKSVSLHFSHKSALEYAKQTARDDAFSRTINFEIHKVPIVLELFGGRLLIDLFDSNIQFNASPTNWFRAEK